MTRKYISIVNSRSLSKIMLIRKCDVTLKIRQENAFPFYFFTKYTSPNCATAVVTNTTPSTLTFLHSNHNTSQTETLTPNVIAAKASNLQTEINTYSYHITSPPTHHLQNIFQTTIIAYNYYNTPPSYTHLERKPSFFNSYPQPRTNVQ